MMNPAATWSRVATWSRRALALVALGAITAAACGHAEGGEGGVPAWPDALPEASAFAAPRGWTALRAAIHVHSLYSHDACDGEPVGAKARPNEPCLERLRRAVCRANLDAVFLTEHDRRLAEADSLRDALLLRAGDTTLLVEGRLAAKAQPCPDGDAAIWFAGAENALMPIAFDSLPRGTILAKQRFYDSAGPGAADSFRAFGAVVLLPHPEDVTLERAVELAPDGIEVYNPHANFAPKHREAQGLSRLGAFVDLFPFYARLTRAHPDLALLAIFRANRDAIDIWDAMLARRKVLGFGATDAHENALPWPLADGERGDAYERMLAWVTNVLLVEPGASGSVEAIEEAVREGRFYVAIEAWGTPVGFDVRLEGSEGTTEMGGTVPFEPGQTLAVELPRVALGGLDPAREPAIPEPRVRARLYRIDPSGRRTVLADSREPIRAAVPGPGAYRVEVAILPRHLTPYLGGHPPDRELAWIYSNAIRVVDR
jgi:hypothetical protein